ncbi:MAG: DUF721 domain-containing protein [Pseudobdellovibrionaceae bacterium]
MDQFKKRSSQLTQSLDVLQSLLAKGKDPLSLQFLRWKIWKKWDEFAGPSIAAVSEPVGYRSGVLSIWGKNASWMQQLVFMREPLKTKINSLLEFQYVREIHLTLDRKSVPADAQVAEDVRSSLDKIE